MYPSVVAEELCPTYNWQAIISFELLYISVIIVLRKSWLITSTLCRLKNLLIVFPHLFVGSFEEPGANMTSSSDDLLSSWYYLTALYVYWVNDAFQLVVFFAISITSLSPYWFDFVDSISRKVNPTASWMRSAPSYNKRTSACIFEEFFLAKPKIFYNSSGLNARWGRIFYRKLLVE